MDRNTRNRTNMQDNDRPEVDDDTRTVRRAAPEPRRQSQTDDGSGAQPQRRAPGARTTSRGELSIDDYVNKLGGFLQNESRGRTFGGRDSKERLVNIEEALNLLEDIRAHIPDSVRYAREVIERQDDILNKANLRASNRQSEAENRARVIMDDAERAADAMMADARMEANRIVNDAQNQARTLINQSDVLRLAQIEAQKLMDEARARDADMQAQTLQFIDEQLSEAEQAISQVLENIHNTRVNFQNIAGKQQGV